MGAIKEQLNAIAYRDLDQILAVEARAVGACAGTPDFQRGVEAVLARQTPRFE
jgi:enoyl-CoA hydratase/carnithine racemase